MTTLTIRALLRSTLTRSFSTTSTLRVDKKSICLRSETLGEKESTTLISLTTKIGQLPLPKLFKQRMELTQELEKMTELSSSEMKELKRVSPLLKPLTSSLTTKWVSLSKAGLDQTITPTLSTILLNRSSLLQFRQTMREETLASTQGQRLS